MTDPEIPEEAVEDVAKAIYEAPHDGLSRSGYDAASRDIQDIYRAEARLALSAARPHLRAQETHGPIGVLGTDLGPFIRCSCGMNPTPQYWLMKHWAGDPEVGKRLVSQFFPSPHPRPVVDREALMVAMGLADGAHNTRSPEVRAYAYETLYGRFADAVLALLGPACTCPTGAGVTHDMRTETGQHLTGCPAGLP